MATVRLEKFANIHSVENGARLVSSLELDAVRNEAYENGVREGAAAASDAFSSEQSRCLSRIQEVIGDTYFAREEAHRLALTSLQPLVESMANALAPAFCSKGLSVEIAQIVTEAARRAPDDVLTIFVPPQQVAEITALLDRDNPDVSIKQDPGLNESEARVDWGGGFDRIDLGVTSSEVLAAVRDFFAEVENSTEKRVQNGNR